MKELERIESVLKKSNTLLYKNDDSGLACAFVNGGLVVDSFVVEDQVIAEALAKKGVNGVVEGSNLSMLRNNYDWFSLHVKSKKLYETLK